MTPFPEVDALRHALDYDPATGAFTWKNPAPRTVAKPGMPAGSIKPNGYVRFTLNGREFLAHRAAWMHYYREPAPAIIDHINGDRSDNRIANLRSVDAAQNLWNNRGKHSATGAFKLTRGPNWAAKIWHRGKRHYLGVFPTKEAAQAAYQEAAAGLRGELHE